MSKKLQQRQLSVCKKSSFISASFDAGFDVWTFTQNEDAYTVNISALGFVSINYTQKFIITRRAFIRCRESIWTVRNGLKSSKL